MDELQEMLAVSAGIQISRSTIWRTLRSKGFTMKKVSSYLYLLSIDSHRSRSHELLQNALQKNDLNIMHALVCTGLNSWYLLTKALWIVVQLIVAVLGQFGAQKHSGRHFLYVVGGKHHIFESVDITDNL